MNIDMLGAMLSFWWPDVMSNHTFLGVGASAAGSVGDGRPIYKTKDGYVIAVCVSDVEWKGLVHAVGKPELADDHRFRTQRDRGAHVREQHEVLKDAFLTRTTEEWLSLLRELDAVSAPVNSLNDLYDDPQIRASRVIWESEHPAAGPYRQPIHPIKFERTPAQFRRHAPLLGEHTEEVLRELGFPSDEIIRLQEAGAIREADYGGSSGKSRPV